MSDLINNDVCIKLTNIIVYKYMQQTNMSSHDKTFIYSITAVSVIPTIIVEVLDNNTQSKGEKLLLKSRDMTF